MLEKLQLLHLLAFITFLLIFILLEYRFPLRRKKWSTRKRWLQNIWLSFLNTLLARVVFFITPISVWLYVQEKNIGLFNVLSINGVFEIIFSVILLDFIIYIQHIFAHKWKWFWKIHSIHHSDKTLDVTTALRFHTLEIILSLTIKIFFVFILGLNPIAIIIFEILLVSSAMFNHANLKIPRILDTYISFLLVTPEFHQVHHSVIQKQTDSNYGFFLSVWDRLFGTYNFHQKRVKEIWLQQNKENLSFKDLILLDIDKKW